MCGSAAFGQCVALGFCPFECCPWHPSPAHPKTSGQIRLRPKVEVTRDEVTVPPGDEKLPLSLPDNKTKAPSFLLCGFLQRNSHPFLPPMATPYAPHHHHRTSGPPSRVSSLGISVRALLLATTRKTSSGSRPGVRAVRCRFGGKCVWGGVCLRLGGGVQVV